MYTHKYHGHVKALVGAPKDASNVRRGWIISWACKGAGDCIAPWEALLYEAAQVARVDGLVGGKSWSWQRYLAQEAAKHGT